MNASSSAPRTRRRLIILATAGMVSMVLLAVSIIMMQPERYQPPLAAIVNQDEPVEIEGQLAPMGRQLAAELVAQQDLFEWEITTADRAEAGLASGKYAAQVTIPSSFSQNVTSMSSLTEAVQADVSVTVRPGTRAEQQSQVELSVTRATDALGAQLTGQFAAGIFGGFAEMGTQLQLAADGAGLIAAGANEAAAGSSELASGMSQLADGAGEAASGIGQLAGGTGELAQGLEELAGGAGQLASGTGELAGGLSQLASGGADLAEGTREAADGATELSDGIGEYVDYVGQVSDGANQINDGVQQIASYLSGVEEGLVQAHEVLNMLEVRLDEFCETEPSSVLCGDGPYAPYTILTTLNGYLIEVETGFGQIQQLIDGIDQLATGLNELSAGGQELAAGMDEYAAGMQDLADGVEDYSLGVGLISQGASELADGTNQLAVGAGTAAGGASQLADGAWQASDGINQLADGTDQLSAGGKELSEGLGQIGGGVGELADGLNLATAEIPDLGEDQTTALGDVLASPIAPPQMTFSSSAGPAAALALLLWLVSLLLTNVYPPAVPHLVSSTRPAFQLAMIALWKPASWSAGVGAVGGLVLAWVGQVSFAEWMALPVMGALIGAIFAALQQALLLSMGKVGTIVSVGSLMVGFSAALAGSGPSVLASLAAKLPTGEATQLLAFLSVPGLPPATGAVIMLFVWLIVALALSALASASIRKNPTKMTPALTA